MYDESAPTQSKWPLLGLVLFRIHHGIRVFYNSHLLLSKRILYSIMSSTRGYYTVSSRVHCLIWLHVPAFADGSRLGKAVLS